MVCSDSAESPAEPPAAPEMPAPDPGDDGKLSAQDAPEALFEAAAVPEAEAADESESLFGTWESAYDGGAFLDESLTAAPAALDLPAFAVDGDSFGYNHGTVFTDINVGVEILNDFRRRNRQGKSQKKKK